MPANNVLVTGSTGFVGQLVQKLWTNAVPWSRCADITDYSLVEAEVGRLLSDKPFDSVLHLAAQSSPRRSLSEARLTWAVNLMGTVHLLEALLATGWEGRFLHVSSGAIYENLSGKITEESELGGDTPYHSSKIAAETAVLEWGRRSGNDVMVVRPFNHTGPGQSTHYFLPSMASQIAELPEAGGTIEVGNLESHRDFSDVRDVIDGYRCLIESGRAQEIYNLASGCSRSLEEILRLLAEKSGKSVRYQVTPERFRAEDTDSFQVDLSKIRQHTDWEPTFSLDDLAKELMEDWMTKACQRKH